MKLSLSLLAAAVAVLPSLITARAIPNDAVATREVFTSLEAEALSNFEVTGLDFEPSIQVSPAKRDVGVENIALIADGTSHQLVGRGVKEEKAKWEVIHTEYKTHARAMEAASRQWKAEKDQKKKDATLKTIITELKA
jgi:hypothetical protein